MPDDVLLTSLLTAVDAAPDDVPLRLHVATLLAERGRPAEALQPCSQALAPDPGNAEPLALLQRLTPTMPPPAAPPPVTPPPTPPQPEPQRLQGYDWTRAED